jgi:DNA-directed RNA polymerase subunit alpha
MTENPTSPGLETVIGGGNPGQADKHYAAAVAFEKEGKRYEAVEELREACSCGANQEHMFRLAYLLDLVGEESEAIAIYEELTLCERPHFNSLLNLSVIYEDRGNLNAAEKCLRQILDTDPTHKRARLYIVDVQSSTDMYYDEEIARDAAKNAAMMNTPVTDFELSVRARNCLKKMEIRSLGDLLKVSENELLSYKNFGETSLVEIKHMLTARGLRLGQGAEGTHVSRIHQDRYEELLNHAPEQILKQPVTALNLSVRARKALQRLNIQTLGDLAIRTEAELMGIKNFGSTSLVEINAGLKAHGLELRNIDE